MKKILLLFILIDTTLLTYAQGARTLNGSTSSDRNQQGVISVLNELENLLHSNPQTIAPFLNSPATTRDLMALSGTNKMKAKELLTKLEHQLQSASVPGPKTTSPSVHDVETNAISVELEKVRNLNQLLGITTLEQNTNIIHPEINRNGFYQDGYEQQLAEVRIESEKQTTAELENYRSELINRLIMEEFSRLNNSQTSGSSENDMSKISKLAQYKALRDLLQEQLTRTEKNAGTNRSNSHILPVNLQPMDELAKQLDQKIREEEIHAEMYARHRIEMEREMKLDLQTEYKNKSNTK